MNICQLFNFGPHNFNSFIIVSLYLILSNQASIKSRVCSPTQRVHNTITIKTNNKAKYQINFVENFILIK
jgi:hypothetical protein